MARISNSCPSQRLVVFIVLLIGAAIGCAASAYAQTAEQAEIFRNLPPDQQRALMEAVQGRRGQQVRTDRVVEFPQTVQPRVPDQEEDPNRRTADGRPRLAGDDTVLIQLEIKRFEDQRLPLPPLTQERTTPGAASDMRAAAGQAPASARGAQQPQDGALQRPPEERKPIVRTEQEQRRLEEIRDRVHRRNPYKLNKWGVLELPEVGSVPLNGLTVEEATRRLSAEWALEEFVVHVTYLPLLPIETAALKPFGYDLFAGSPSTFAPVTDIPVPAEYVVGPGDVFEVQLIGSTPGRHSLVVGRDGRIDFPQLGPIPVSGRRFDDVRSDLESRVAQQMIGTQAHVTLGELRSIRVFVLGDAERPGSYTVSGLSTMTNALFVSGGIKKIGSLRNIQLKRDGKTVSTLDLYDLLLRGDTSADARLLPGDVIFVPPIGATVSVAGEVRRPAIYELKTETTVEEVLQLAGGLTPSADRSLATLERVNVAGQRVVQDVILANAAAESTTLRAGDILRVRAIRPTLENSVSLQGHVYRPGEYEFRQNMKLLDLIPSMDELKPNADLGYVLVRREMPYEQRIRVFSASLEEAFANPQSAANFELAARDRVYVFDLESGRDRVIQPLMRELQLQSAIDEPTAEVSISGQVRVPGRYPLESGMRLSDLLRAGGGLSEAAYGGQAELTRYTIGEDQTRRAELIEIDLRAVLAGDPTADIPLRAFDHAVIKEVPLWASQEEVEILGEVRFPGRYPIQRGETLSSLLSRAGGLTEFAFTEGTVFTRRELQERERRQLEMLANRMQSDLAQLSLQAAQEGGRDAGQALAVGQSLLDSLREAEPVGRLVIDLNRSLKGRRPTEDVILKDGDRLVVPRITQEVTVIGEVQSATSHLYNASFSRDDYIAMSGGLTPRADKDRIYVVRANGAVEAGSGKKWFAAGSTPIKPGDTIVVPLDTERMRPLPFWQAVTQIIYNLAIPLAVLDRN
jgi:polysaccharide export outer membrane protein